VKLNVESPIGFPGIDATPAEAGLHEDLRELMAVEADGLDRYVRHVLWLRDVTVKG